MWISKGSGYPVTDRGRWLMGVGPKGEEGVGRGLGVHVHHGDRRRGWSSGPL